MRRRRDHAWLRLALAALALFIASETPPAAQDQPDDPQMQVDAPDVSARAGAVRRCEMSFKVTNFTILLGRQTGCGRIACDSGAALEVDLSATKLGLLNMTQLEGTASFDEPGEMARVLGSYQGRGVTGAIGVGAQKSVWENEAGVKLDISGTMKGLAVDAGGGRLEVVRRDGARHCDVGG